MSEKERIASIDKKLVYIETLGCAMNVRDSDHMLAELKEIGYAATSSPSSADLILINTCSVREKPERKLFSEIGVFAKHKKPGCKIGVTGCTASSLGSEIIQRSPHVDFVLGARNISKIRDVINIPKAVEVDTSYDDTNYAFAPIAPSGHNALLNISVGCDKACSYCIVPTTRGAEISIPASILLKEARALASRGVKELMLLGQNVNNYGVRFSSAHERIDFATLLAMIGEIDGIERIRFTSPHPLHMDERFIREFASNKKVCKSIHMPLQSGSSQILKAMRRGYSKEWFLDKVAAIRELCPEVGISTDIIVGYLGESEADFAQTLEVVESVGFDVLYSFVFSPRRDTHAYRLLESRRAFEIDKEIANKRLRQLQALHREILHKRLRDEIGTHAVVLVDEIKDGFALGRSDTGRLLKVGMDAPSTRDSTLYKGPSEGNASKKPVNDGLGAERLASKKLASEKIEIEKLEIGKLYDVRIERLVNGTLFASKV